LSGAFAFRATSVHRIPRQRVVTIAIRPSLVARDGRASRADLPVGESGKFLRNGLDSPAAKLPDGQINCHATVDVGLPLASDGPGDGYQRAKAGVKTTSAFGPQPARTAERPHPARTQWVVANSIL